MIHSQKSAHAHTHTHTHTQTDRKNHDNVVRRLSLQGKFSIITSRKLTQTILYYTHWKLEKFKLTMQREITNSQKNEENERRANEEKQITDNFFFDEYY